jgi:hypothetical protein
LFGRYVFTWKSGLGVLIMLDKLIDSHCIYWSAHFRFVWDLFIFY